MVYMGLRAGEWSERGEEMTMRREDRGFAGYCG